MGGRLTVAGSNGDLWTGPRFMAYETYIRASHMEVFLNGEPPRCEVAVDECIPIDSPTRTPQFRPSRFAYIVESLRWKLFF